MKKLMLSVFAAAVLGAGGSALAQDGGADCQAGSAWGPKAGCNEARTMPQYQDGGWSAYPQQPYIYGNRVYPYPPAVERRAYPHTPYAPYAATRRDRDGDGVRNNRDRFPDDPSRY